MIFNEVYEEYFLNSCLSQFNTTIGGFLLRYIGTDIATNCIFPLYEKDDEELENKIFEIENFLLDKNIHPIYRLVYQDNYQNLDRVLFSKRYEKIDQSVVLGCKLKGKEEQLFKFSDFNESGIFVDEGITPNDYFLEDYFHLKEMDKNEISIFNASINRIDMNKYALSLVESNHLIGQAFFFVQEDVAIIKDIVISEKYRDLGYSSRILYSILTYCIKKEINLVIAEVFLSNKSAVSLFSSNLLFFKLYDIFYKSLLRGKNRLV